jgi:hypothetical protein
VFGQVCGILTPTWRNHVLGATGKLSAGTITPAADATAGQGIPNRIVAADVYNAAAWTYTDRASGGVLFPVLAAEVKHLPGSYVKDIFFAAGTYLITFYLDA